MENIITYFGKDINTMSCDELREALIFAVNEILRLEKENQRRVAERFDKL